MIFFFYLSTSEADLFLFKWMNSRLSAVTKPISLPKRQTYASRRGIMQMVQQRVLPSSGLKSLGFDLCWQGRVLPQTFRGD